jgi:hypothetical protein
MKQVIPIPKKDAFEALWYINEYFGFKYLFKTNFSLLASLTQDNFPCVPYISQERISSLLENILNLDRHEYELVHRVLWLNANINHPNLDNSFNAQLGSHSVQGHDKDLLKLFIWANRIPEGKEITLSYSQGNKKMDAVKIDNTDNWFINTCKSWGPSGITVDEAKAKLVGFKRKPGRDSGNERLCVAYGVFRFLRDTNACFGERTSALLHFIWKYLFEMGLVDADYDPDNTSKLNVNLGRYDRKFKADGGTRNFHFQKLQLLSFPQEVLSFLITRGFTKKPDAR